MESKINIISNIVVPPTTPPHEALKEFLNFEFEAALKQEESVGSKVLNPLNALPTSQTVSSKPRTWSSYSNIRAKDVQDLINMNATEEIAVYKDCPSFFQSPTLTRRTLGYSYDFPEKSPKKDKKWSITNIFRRKKKEESDSSSEEDSQKKGFLNRRRKKPENKRKRHIKTIGTFDHVVVPPAPRNSMICNGYQEDNGVFSDPTGGFSNYIGRPLPQPPSESSQKFSRESLNDLNNSRVSLGSGSVDSTARKSRREQIKARAEARRTSPRKASSSDEESQRSNSSLKIRSEENLRPRDNSSNRKSRAARTERYFKRHSKDGENPHNYLRLSKSDAENSVMNWKLSDDSNRSPSRSPLVPSPAVSTDNARNKLPYTHLNTQSNSFSGLSTIPPSHNSHSRFRVSNSTSNPTYKPAQSMNDYNNSIKKLDLEKYFSNQRSVSCDANIHKTPSAEFVEEVLHVQFPIARPNRGYRNLSLIDPSQLSKARQPPPPPPRDPSRMITTHHFEGGRPNTFYFDSSGQSKSKSFNNTNSNPMLQQTKKINSFNLNPSYRSTSEDHLPRENLGLQLSARPSSTTPDSSNHRYVSRRREIRTNPEDFNYLTDKHPRSRKPIFIQPQPGTKTAENNSTTNDSSGSQKALDFWKKIDRQNANVEKPILKKTRSNSPQIFTSHTRVQTKVFLPSVVQNDIKSNSPLLNDNRTSSPFKPVTPTLQEITNQSDTNKPTLSENGKEDAKRKSSNLEEALDELEAIYNSLRLGDDDLLERAEQREKESQVKKHLLAHIDVHPNYSARGALSDSSFSYEPFDSVSSPRRKRVMRKNRTVDLKQDDMAFRKLNKERANTINDPQSVISKISYLQASPVYGKKDTNEEILNSNEPDITHDDVVYRNVKYSNNTLKVVEPQPPFGIPIGPVTPAANSDYLHAKPENIVYKPTFKHKKIPDIVKDDLAFRNLRKDDNKGPALPPLSAEDYRNNNSDSLSYLKKKRAQRSLSANIGSLIHADVIEKAKNRQRQNNNDIENEFKTLTDIADAMEIARRVLKEKDNKITATNKAFMSDTDTQYIRPPLNASSLREDRLSFLNGLKVPDGEIDRNSKPSSPRLHGNHILVKPPRGLTPERRRSPKESTPIPLSPLEDKKGTNTESTSSLEDILNALAEEAKETTEKITNELKLLAEEKEKKSRIKKKREDEKEDQLKSEDLTKKLSDIDAVSEHAKLCEKLLECVVDSTALMSSSKTTEEVVEQIQEKPIVIESANVVVDRSSPKNKNKETTESDHDYENLHSDKELNIDEVDVNTTLEEAGEEPVEQCRSPFEEHKEELIATFQELRGNIDSIELPFKREKSESRTEETEATSSKVDSVYDNLEGSITTVDDNNQKEGVTGEEACVGVFELALPNKECAFTINANPVDGVQISNCDIILRKPNHFILHEDSETSSGFHSNCSCGESSHYPKSDTLFDEFGSNTNLDSLESLKSPKLVLATSHKVPSNDLEENSSSFPKSTRLVLEASRCTMDLSNTNINASNSGERKIPCRRNSRSERHTPDNSDEKPSPSWYRDPATVAFACSYGIACAHQLASIDLFAILGILFAVISFIAALFL